MFCMPQLLDHWPEGGGGGTRSCFPHMFDNFHWHLIAVKKESRPSVARHGHRSCGLTVRYVGVS